MIYIILTYTRTVESQRIYPVFDRRRRLRVTIIIKCLSFFSVANNAY